MAFSSYISLMNSLSKFLLVVSVVFSAIVFWGDVESNTSRLRLSARTEIVVSSKTTSEKYITLFPQTKPNYGSSCYNFKNNIRSQNSARIPHRHERPRCCQKPTPSWQPSATTPYTGKPRPSRLVDRGVSGAKDRRPALASRRRG